MLLRHSQVSTASSCLQANSLYWNFEDESIADTHTARSSSYDLFHVTCGLLLYQSDLIVRDRIFVDRSNGAYAADKLRASGKSLQGNHLDPGVYTTTSEMFEPRHGDFLCTIQLYPKSSERSTEQLANSTATGTTNQQSPTGRNPTLLSLITQQSNTFIT